VTALLRFSIKETREEGKKKKKKKQKDMHSFELAIVGFPCEFNLYSHLRHRLPNHEAAIRAKSAPRAVRRYRRLKTISNDWT